MIGASVCRDEGSGQSALGEQVPQQIRDPERDVEGVALSRSAKGQSEELLPQKAKHPRRQGREREQCRLRGEAGTRGGLVILRLFG